MKKNFVLDTNVLLHDPAALFKFADNTVIIPIYVIEEVDQFKKESSERGRNARQIARHLDTYRQQGNLGVGVPLENGGVLKVMFTNKAMQPQSMLNSQLADNMIMAVALEIQQLEPMAETVFITKDTNLRVRADALGLKAVNYEEAAVSIDKLYPGVTELEISGEQMERFYAEKGLQIPHKRGSGGHQHNMFAMPTEEKDEEDELPVLHANEYALLRNASRPGNTALGRFVTWDDKIIPLRVDSSSEKSVWGIRPRNKEQHFALDALLDDRIKLVTLLGKAGTGKAQPLDAKVLTPTGWKRMGQLETGMEVLTPAGSSARILGVFPQGVKPIWRVRFTDGSSTECCLDHLWHTRTLAERDAGEPGAVRSLREVMKTLRVGGLPNHTIPLCEAQTFKTPGGASNANMDEDPYSLGARVAALWTDALAGASEERPDEGRGDDAWGNRSVAPQLPNGALFASIPARIATLQGIMDNAGRADEDGGFSVLLPGESAVATISFLAQSLGGTATATFEGQAWRVTLTLPASAPPFSDARRQGSAQSAASSSWTGTRTLDCVEYVGEKEAQCILIDDPEHLYLTDDCIVTHNTLLALAAGLQRMIDNQQFKKLLVSRPVFPLGRDIGHLPGSVEDKLNPWMQPIFDNVELLLGLKHVEKRTGKSADEMIRSGLLQIEPLTFIRGRSIPNQYLIVDESQNLTPHEVKTIITRVGQGTKVVLTGDPYQIDNPYVDSESNGLTYTINRFKGQEIAATVTLLKGERSPLAELASNLL